MKREINIKRLLLLAFTSVIPLLSYSQQNDDKFNLYLSLGVKYVPVDDYAGPLIGLSLDKKSSKFAYNYRSDMVFGVSGQAQSLPRTYQVTDFTTFNYLDVDYKIYKKFRVTAGLGWVYGGWGRNSKLDETSGFVVGTLAIKYKVFWLDTEVRGDIPLMTKRQQATMGGNFPISFALIYRFVPKS